jgi:hypothetical protein
VHAVALGASWKNPLEQAEQLTEPSACWNWPGWHASHAVALSSAWKNPASHASGANPSTGQR